MQDPLKQGLKLDNFRSCYMYSNNSNARSTKTRIETKTQFYKAMIILIIRMQDPLKQGLKPETVGCDVGIFEIRMQDPLKQGLKPARMNISADILVLFECKIH